ncbi:hypothetical protein JTE90_025545 [Oedothorax gibbosus]|uniref:Uncharacterized protein n=1 Tax=Oedothorax gibbosus TaxID=931172 RepID=A0AAV6TX88_9ARAC|nr:hypothetical protein JTE90_025545 [Oedothorax gibbosus]
MDKKQKKLSSFNRAINLDNMRNYPDTRFLSASVPPSIRNSMELMPQESISNSIQNIYPEINVNPNFPGPTAPLHEYRGYNEAVQSVFVSQLVAVVLNVVKREIIIKINNLNRKKKKLNYRCH